MRCRERSLLHPFNFGPKAPRCTITFQSPVAAIWQQLIQALIDALKSGTPITDANGNEIILDWARVAEEAGIPVSVIAIEEVLKRTRDMVEAQSPPDDGSQDAKLSEVALYDPEQRRDARGRWTAVGSLASFVASALDSNGYDWTDIGVLTDEEVQRAKGLGFEVAGYHRVVDTDAIRHVKRSHPNVSVQDIASYPDLINGPNVTVSASQTRLGLKALKYEIPRGDGVIVIEEVRNRRGVLALRTMYYKGGTNADVS